MPEDFWPYFMLEMPILVESDPYRTQTTAFWSQDGALGRGFKPRGPGDCDWNANLLQGIIIPLPKADWQNGDYNPILGQDDN